MQVRNFNSQGKRRSHFKMEFLLTQTDSTLKSKVDSLWNRFWSGGISNPLTAIEQMSYLIFLKRLEDNDNANAAAAKRRNLEFKSVFNKKKVELLVAVAGG